MDCRYCDDTVTPAGMTLLGRCGASRVLLLHDAGHPGRCVVLAPWHVRDLFDLDDAQRTTFMADVSRVARTVQSALEPGKVNIAFFGDRSDHLHAHVVPKWHDHADWGRAFALEPLDGPMAASVADRLRAALQT